MILRIEFQHIKSYSYYLSRLLGIVKKFQTFKQEIDTEGTVLYSVEFDENQLDSALGVYEFVRNWKGTAYYIDGVLISRKRAYDLLWDNLKIPFLINKIHGAKNPRDLIDPDTKLE